MARRPAGVRPVRSGPGSTVRASRSAGLPPRTSFRCERRCSPSPGFLLRGVTIRPLAGLRQVRFRGRLIGTGRRYDVRSSAPDGFTSRPGRGAGMFGLLRRMRGDGRRSPHLLSKRYSHGECGSTGRLPEHLHDPCLDAHPPCRRRRDGRMKLGAEPHVQLAGEGLPGLDAVLLAPCQILVDGALELPTKLLRIRRLERRDGVRPVTPAQRSGRRPPSSAGR